MGSEVYAKIFRPWDCRQDSGAQDSTISTTTEVEDCASDKTAKHVKREEAKPATSPSAKKGFRRPRPKPREETKAPPELLGSSHPLDSYHQIFPDVCLAQTLGLAPNDPLFLETLAQGCAFEEYARVLGQEQRAKILNVKKQRPKKYKCPHCNVGFSNNGQLKGHIRIHTGERPFKCDQKDCGKTFTRNEELTRHKRIHSGLRPYPCAQCGKRFGRKDHLKKHSRTHFQPRGLYAVPVVLPFETWANPPYPFVPMFGY